MLDGDPHSLLMSFAMNKTPCLDRDLCHLWYLSDVFSGFVLAALIIFGAWMGWQAMADKFWSSATRTLLAEANQVMFLGVVEAAVWQLDRRPSYNATMYHHG